MRLEVMKFAERRYQIYKDRTGYYSISFGKRSLVINTKKSDAVNLR